MGYSERLGVTGSTYCVRFLDSENDLSTAYRLRYSIFSEKLGWIESNKTHADQDGYDSFSRTIGVFHKQGKLVGTVRVTPPGVPFMLATVFSALLPSEFPREKFSSAAEVSRLAIDPSIDPTSKAFRDISLLLYRKVYHWCLDHDINHLYLVVAPSYLRSLKILGLPCAAIALPVKLPPANVESVAAVIDWDRFGYSHNRKFFQWMSDGRDTLGKRYREQDMATHAG